MSKRATPASAGETATAPSSPAEPARGDVAPPAPGVGGDAGRDRLPVRTCQHKLLILWCGMSAVALVVVMVQTASGGVYAAHAGDVFDWLLPTVVPTLSLMVGTVVADARAADSGAPATVDAFTYRFVFWVSLAYLVLVILALLMNAQSPDPVGALRALGKIVSGLYTVVGISLGAFFVTRKSGS